MDVGGSVSLRPWAEWKGEGNLSTSIHLSWLRRCGCSLTSCFKLPPLYLLLTGWMFSQTVS